MNINAKKIGLALAVPTALLFSWSLVENHGLLCVSRYETDFAAMPRTVQISDLHKRRFSRGQKRLIRTVAALEPELIVITGDLVSRTELDFHETESLLKELCAIATVIVAEGNHEADLSPGAYAGFRDAVRRSGARLLDNEIVRWGDICIAGLRLPPTYYRGGGFLAARGKYECTAGTLWDRLGSCPPDTLLLAHNPRWFPAYAEWGARLTLSGHIHGGIVRLPGIGGILSPERTFFPRYAKGLYSDKDAEMIVSGGLGKPRLFNPPELCLITPKSD
ncbi:MAG: metallophosphoesterase [Oscillospiraceae bacterium]|nr:metallophosphoesterase [Oscillospiraceae bacterium]